MIRVLLVMLLAVWPGSFSLAQVVLNEIMFNPAGAESTDEFIEILNTNPADTVDLAGWKIGDDSLDRLRDAGEGFRLAPGAFALIVDPDNLDLAEGYREKIPDAALLLTVESRTLGNAGLSNSKPETVRLVNAKDSCVASYRYHIGNRPGYSDEKIDPSGPDDASNWSDGRVSGGTPGARNSVAKARFNLGLINIRFEPERSMPGEPVWIIVRIRNTGMEPGEAIVGFNWDWGSDSVSTGRIAQGDSVDVKTLLNAPATGRYRITACLTGGDDDVSDNCLDGTLIVGAKTKCLVINEIMAHPLPGEPEWIELWNIGPDEIDLAGWRISDATAHLPLVVSESSARIHPNGFAVIASVSKAWTFFPNPELLLTPESFPRLNDDGDRILLFDDVGTMIDQVPYEGNQLGCAGQSLERISANAGSADPSNWSPCASPEGATPGKINSVYSDGRTASASLDVSPNPFSPDGDGFEDRTSLSFRLPTGVYSVSLRIFDMQGRGIRTLLSGNPSGANRTVEWDGLDDRGQTARIGLYLAHLEAVNRDNHMPYHAIAIVALAERL